MEVSFVVVMYNPVLDKLLKTLDSILKQKNISYEIIIADDGSNTDYSETIKAYFDNSGFSAYTIVKNEINGGTVNNLHSGLERADGEFVKIISPGDYIYGSDTIRKWIDFVKDEYAEWSFSDAIYYREDDGEIIPICDYAHPNDITPYRSKRINKCRWNYVAFNDIALGAAIISKTQLCREYCNLIRNRVKYAEDNMYRIMMFDGITAAYFPKPTVLYEYGTGVSTNGNSVWRERLQKDWQEADKIMFCDERKAFDTFQTKIKNCYSGGKRLFTLCVLLHRIRKKLFQRKTIGEI